MKRIVITEEQAKKLVQKLVTEQQTDEIKYNLGGLNIIVKDGNPYYIGEDALRYDLPKLSQIEVGIHPSNLQLNGITNTMIEGQNLYGIYEGEPTQLAKDLAEKYYGFPTSGPKGPGFYVIVFDDLVTKIPILAKINVLSGLPAGSTVKEVKTIKEKEGQSIIFAQTRTKNYVLTISDPLRRAVVSGSGEDGEKEIVYYCVTRNTGKKSILPLKRTKGDTEGDVEFIKSQDKRITDAQGPFMTKEEAASVCQPKLPELLPFGDFFANNVSKIKLSPSMPFVKQLTDYFDAGGTLSKITIKASASRVPAGHVEGDKEGPLWKETRTYDNSATGDNDDGTGNLQLTKARAYNLYAALIQMFPQLTNVPRELIALGSIGDPYKKSQKPKPGQNPNDPSLKGDDPNDPKFANFRRVDLILNK